MAGGYIVSFWIIIQAMAATFGGFNVPDWVFRMVVVLLLVGFPFALAIAWLVENDSDWKRKPTLILASTGLILLSSIGLAFWQPWGRGHAGAIPSAAAPDELLRVRTILESLDAIPEDYSLAEHMVELVLAEEPLNVRAIILMARVQVTFLYRGFDLSEERNRKARQYCERAVALAPDDPEAQALLGIFYVTAYRDAPRAFHTLDQAAQAAPDDSFIWRFRASALRRWPGIDPDVVIKAMEANVRRFPEDPLVSYDLARYYRDLSQYDKMEAWMDRTLEIYPLPNAMVYKAQLRFAFYGELEPLRMLSGKIHPRMRSNERYLLFDWIYAMAGNDPEYGLASLQKTTTDWFRDFTYTGPRALLEGQLYDLAGKPELARKHYERALELMNQNPDGKENERTYALRTWIFLGLGRVEEARASHALMMEAIIRPHRFDAGGVGLDWFDPILVSFGLNQREIAFTLIRESLSTGASDQPQRFFEDNLRAMRIHLSMDPRIEEWQNDPALQDLLAGQ